MLLCRIRGSREELRSLRNSSVFVQPRGLHKIAKDLFEVVAVLEPFEVSLLEINGYQVVVKGDVKTVLAQRLRAVNRAVSPSADDLFSSVAANDGYMPVQYIDTWVANLPALFPTLVDLISLPNPTWENRLTSAVHLRAGAPGDRPAVVFISGVHASELGGPDAAVYFLYRLINAWRNNTAIALGRYTFSAASVQRLLNDLDLYVVPCINPDGRRFVFESLEWWRKNRNPNVGMGQVGVDINRNYDFLWSSGMGSSLFPQDDTYRGPAAFSEPETRNVQWLIDQTGADYFMDIHGPSGAFVYNWGDARDQSTDPTMNFRNPTWDGRRVAPYGEYLSASDLGFLKQLGARVVSAANLVDNGLYDSQQSFDDLYPTTATSDDYAFSRHFTNPAAAKTYGFTFEYGGGEFYPAYQDMMVTIAETNAAMLEFASAAVPGASST